MPLRSARTFLMLSSLIFPHVPSSTFHSIFTQLLAKFCKYEVPSSNDHVKKIRSVWVVKQSGLKSPISFLSTPFVKKNDENIEPR